jgi:hypothetical protein
MPLFEIITSDMFQCSDVVDLYINPVNTMSTPGSVGLATVFRDKVPSYIPQYKEACRTKELRMGTLQVIEDTNQSWGMVNLPVKEHYGNHSEPSDISRSLEALRNLLKETTYRYSTICLPMLTVGMGPKDYEIVYPPMIDHLSDLDATVFLSMHPDKTESRPKYLTIIGPEDYGLNKIETDSIDWVIDKAMESWGTSLSDYTGIISGGHTGVDRYIGGNDYLKDIEATYVYRKTNKPCLVIKPNEIRNGSRANVTHGELLCEIASDIIMFKPNNHNNNRMTAMQLYIEEQKEKREALGLPPRRVAIFGDKSTSLYNTNIKISVRE